MIKIEVKDHVINQQVEADSLMIIYEATEIIYALVCTMKKVLGTDSKDYAEEILLGAYKHIKKSFRNSEETIVDMSDL